MMIREHIYQYSPSRLDHKLQWILFQNARHESGMTFTSARMTEQVRSFITFFYIRFNVDISLKHLMYYTLS